MKLHDLVQGVKNTFPDANFSIQCNLDNFENKQLRVKYTLHINNEGRMFYFERSSLVELWDGFVSELTNPEQPIAELDERIQEAVTLTEQ